MFPAKFVDLYVCPDCSRIAFLNTPGKKNILLGWCYILFLPCPVCNFTLDWIFWCHILQYSDAVPGGTDSKSVVYHLLR